MRSKMKGLFIGAILGVGAGLVINKLLGEKSVDEIKEDAKENLDKVKEVAKENIEKVKDIIEENKKGNTSTVKVKI